MRPFNYLSRIEPPSSHLPDQLCRNWHLGSLERENVETFRRYAGCRGFTGPVPLPLWIRVFEAMRLLAGTIPAWWKFVKSLSEKWHRAHPASDGKSREKCTCVGFSTTQDCARIMGQHRHHSPGSKIVCLICLSCVAGDMILIRRLLDGDWTEDFGATTGRAGRDDLRSPGDRLRVRGRRSDRGLIYQTHYGKPSSTPERPRDSS